jgi:dTDP-L-rhamnose 4-epimerase
MPVGQVHIMKILVTGGAGFIGSHLVDKLVSDGHDVKVLDRLDEQVHQGKKPDYLNPRAEYVFGDINDGKMLKKAVGDAQAIYHQAAAVGVGQSMYEITKYVDANTCGTAKLLETLVNTEHGVRKLIVASSMSIYGEGAYMCATCGTVYPKLREDGQMKSKQWEMLCPSCGKTVSPLPTNEEKPLFPTSIYAITKRDQEEMCLTIGRAYGIPTVALRYFNVYGPRQSLSNPYTGVCAIFSSSIKNGNPPLIFEDGKQMRDFINVKDIVQANMLALKNPSMNYGSFNVGTGKALSINDIAETLLKLYGKEGSLRPKIINKFRSGDIRHCFSDISRIKKMGFKPKVGFEEGMIEFVKWGKAATAEDKFGKAENELEGRSLIKS